MHNTHARMYVGVRVRVPSRRALQRLSLHKKNCKTSIMKSTKVQTLGANIWPGVDAAKELLRVRKALRKRMR